MFSRVITATIEGEMEQLMELTFWGAGVNLNAIYFEFLASQVVQ